MGGGVFVARTAQAVVVGIVEVEVVAAITEGRNSRRGSSSISSSSSSSSSSSWSSSTTTTNSIKSDKTPPPPPPPPSPNSPNSQTPFVKVDARVIIVGAGVGTGSIQNLTIRAANILKSADVVIYDDLGVDSDETLALCGQSTARKYTSVREAGERKRTHRKRRLTVCWWSCRRAGGISTSSG